MHSLKIPKVQCIRGTIDTKELKPCQKGIVDSALLLLGAAVLSAVQCSSPGVCAVLAI